MRWMLVCIGCSASTVAPLPAPSDAEILGQYSIPADDPTTCDKPLALPAIDPQPDHPCAIVTHWPSGTVDAVGFEYHSDFERESWMLDGSPIEDYTFLRGGKPWELVEDGYGQKTLRERLAYDARGRLAVTVSFGIATIYQRYTNGGPKQQIETSGSFEEEWDPCGNPVSLNASAIRNSRSEYWSYSDGEIVHDVTATTTHTRHWTDRMTIAGGKIMSIARHTDDDGFYPAHDDSIEYAYDGERVISRTTNGAIDWSAEWSGDRLTATHDLAQKIDVEIRYCD